MHKPLESLLIALLTFQTVILIWYRDQSAWMITIVGALLIWFAFYEWDVLAKKKRFLQNFMRKWDPDKSSQSAPTGSALNKTRKQDAIDLKRVEESVHVAVQEPDSPFQNRAATVKRLLSPTLGTVLAYLVPISVLLGVVLVNIFPYGLDQTIQLDVGSDTDTEGVLQVKDMGNPQEIANTPFRGIRDMGTLLFDPIVLPEPTDIFRLSLTGSHVFWQKPPVFPSIGWQEIQSEDLVAEADHTLYSQILSPEVDSIENQETFAILLKGTFLPGEELITGNITLTLTPAEVVLGLDGTEYRTLLPGRFLGREQEIALAYDGEYKLFLSQELVGRFPGLPLTSFETQYQNARFTAGFDPLEATFSTDNQCLVLDGKTRLILPESSDRFDDNAFSVSLDWTPSDNTLDTQQIMGHFNWELSQNKTSVQFRVGRTNPDGEFFRISHPIGENFFDQTHSLLAVYSPAPSVTQDGYIELYINDFLVGRQNIGQATIQTDYSQNLTIGQSYHGSTESSYFEGQVCNPMIRMQALPGQPVSDITVPYHTIEQQIPVFGNGALQQVRVKIE